MANSARILLNSKSPRFPNGLGNDSGTLGRYIIEHHARIGAVGQFEGFADRYYRGNRPNGIYVPRFRNVDAASRQESFLRGYGMQGGASRLDWQRGAGMPGVGKDLKEALRTPCLLYTSDAADDEYNV